jgi:hypothetical protein
MPWATSPAKQKIHLQWWHRNVMARGYQLTPEELRAVEENGSARDIAAARSGQFAQTFNQSIANQGVRAGATQVSNNTQTSSAPPTAAAAPTKGQDNIFTGLADALNQNQKRLEKSIPGYVADEYVFEFAPASLTSAKVTKPGNTTYKNTAGKNIKTARDKADPDTDSVATNSQTWQVQAGTQIVQLIDQIMRSSTYITDQQKVNFDDEGKQTKNPKAGSGGVTAWFKINVSAKQLGYDKQRRDHAYRITYTISQYAINQMSSIYFNDSKYRGPHKAYNYWFTGLNTQILSYEQEYNQSYYTTLSGNSSGLASTPPTGRDQFKQTTMATSEQRGQGQSNYVNEPADSAASFLYSVADFAEVRMKIVGDPAWMQQGEAAFGVKTGTFEFTAFNSDGSINYDSQEVTYTVSFNRPTDYDFNTGIMNVNSGSGAPQEKFTYIAKSCKNIFSKGRFEQELVGSLLPASSTAGSNNRANQTTAATDSRSNKTNDGSLGYEIRDETGQLSNLRKNEYGDLYDPTGTSTGPAMPAPQPAPSPEPPTSGGDIDYSTESALIPTAPGVSEPPQLIARDDS